MFSDVSDHQMVVGVYGDAAAIPEESLPEPQHTFPLVGPDVDLVPLPCVKFRNLMFA